MDTAQKEIPIKPSPQETIRTLLTTLVEDPSSDFRQKWAEAVLNEELKKIINDYETYPTLSSLLTILPFSAKKALFQTLIEELKKKEVEGKRIFASTQDQKLTEILRRLNEPEVQDAIRKAYELPFWVDLDFLGDLVRALKIGVINKEEFLKILKEKGLSNQTVQQELAKIHGDIPKGFFSDRLAEITRERQSPQPLQQSVAEAVSNSIDAIWTKHGQERRIGQWGRGIKMLLSYLNHPQDSITVTTTQNNETWQIEIRKGGDGRFYLRSSQIEPEPSQQPKQSGTTVVLKKHQPLNQDFLEELKGRLKNRFRFTPEVEIRINNELINQYENLIDVKENKPMKRHRSLGTVNVSLTPKEIVIEDNGCGMSPDQLLSMFIVGAGSKPFEKITDEDRELYLLLIEVFYDDKPAKEQAPAKNIINFSRNRETILSLPLSSDRINLFDKPLFFELGPLLESSDAREEVKINKNFQDAVKKAVDIIVEGETDPKQKIAILNSLVAGLTSLGGREKGEKKTDIFSTIASIISYTNTKAQPLIASLSSQGYLFMPNYPEFSNLKLADDPKTVFIDPLLFSFTPEKLNLPGFEQVSPSIFQSSTGKRLFLADFKDGSSPIITYNDGFILDKKVWQKILSLKEKNPQDFEVLVEALELRLNPVSTSYDPHEQPLTNLQNRLVFEEKNEKIKEGIIITQWQWPDWLSNENLRKKIQQINTIKKELISNKDDQGNPVFVENLTHVGDTLYLTVGNVNSGYKLMSIKNDGELKEVVSIEGRDSQGDPVFVRNLTSAGDTLYLTVGNVDSGYKLMSIKNDGELKELISNKDDQGDPVFVRNLTHVGDTLYLTVGNVNSGYKLMSIKNDGELKELISNKDDQGNPVFVENLTSAGDTLYLTTVGNADSGYKLMSIKNDGELKEVVSIEGRDSQGNLVFVRNLTHVGDVLYFTLGNLFDSYKLVLIRPEKNPINLIDLLNKCYLLLPNPQVIVDSLVIFFSPDNEMRNKKIANLNQILNWLSNENNADFIQNLFENLPPEINQLDAEEKNRFMSRFLVNLLETSFQISTFENAQELLNILFDGSNNLHLLLDFSLINLQQDQDVLRQISQLVSPEENFFQQQLYFSLINGFFFVEKNPTKRQIFLDKLTKIKNHPSYQKYLQLVNSYSEEEIRDLFSKESLERETPGRGLIEFLKKEEGIVLNEVSLIEITQSWGVNEQNQSVFQRSVSIAEILYQYKIKRLRNWQEVIDAINQTSATNLSLEQFRQEIIKEIFGQAIEEGVARREMIQNGVDAIKNRRETTEGKIDIRLFKAYDEKGEYLIEEFTDNGTGIVDWLKFFIPGETTKGVSDQGFFGSGAFKIFEGIDRVDMISSIDGKTAYYFRFEWQNGNLFVTKSQIVNNFPGQQGTSIRRIKKIKDQDLPELEAGIMADDYLAFAGLLADEQINGKTIEVVINGEPIHLKKTKRLSEDFIYNDVNYGKITLVESPLPPTVAHGVGLRMSDLDERYLTYVPDELKKLIKDKKISIILPKDLPLIKDRSRIANEEELLDPLARKIAGMVIKLAAQELILGFKQRNESGDSYRIWKPPGFPDDWFINPKYSLLYTSNEFTDIVDYIKSIIKKLNDNDILTSEELSFINQPFDLQSRLAMVIVGLNVNLPDGNISNPWKERLKILRSIQSRAGEIQERLAKLIAQEESLISSFGIYQPEAPNPSFTPESLQQKGERIIKYFLGQIHEETISEEQLTEAQKQNLALIKKIASVFNISVVPKVNIGAAGYFSGNRFVIDATALSLNQSYCVEIAFHELAHYIEALSQRHLGPIYTHLFTHQVDGPFSQAYYQVLEEVLTKYPPQ